MSDLIYEQIFLHSLHSKEMDGNGKVVRSGEWVNGEYQCIVVPSSLTTNPMEIEELTIGDEEYNDASVTEFKLSGLTRLKFIEFGQECFFYAPSFSLTGLID